MIFLSLAGLKNEFKDMKANLDTAIGDYRAVIDQQIAGTYKLDLLNDFADIVRNIVPTRVNRCSYICVTLCKWVQ